MLGGICAGLATLGFLLAPSAASAQNRPAAASSADPAPTASPSAPVATPDPGETRSTDAVEANTASAQAGQTGVQGGEADQAGEVPVPAPPPGADLPPVEPVITDQEFNAAVPPLKAGDDAELNRPLESIEAFERRVAQDQAGAKPQEGQAPPAGAPALSDQTATEEIGDAPITDAELTKPLPPLGEFQVEPVQLGAAEPGEKAASVRYVVKVNGLEAADTDTATDLAGEFKQFSALQDAKGKASNGAMVAARLTEDSALLQRILASEGWYEASVKTRIEQAATAAPDAPLTAVLDVIPGKRYQFSDITFDAGPTVPPELIRNNFALKIGEPIVADRVQGAEAQVALALPENGYAFAKVGDRDILLDQDTGKGAYTLPVEVGPRSRFDGFATKGDEVFGTDHIAVLARFKRGDLYDSRKVDDLRKALVATGLFGTVGVEPQRTGESAGDDTEYARLLVQQNAGPPRTIAGTIGYGSGEGFRADASWTHRNLFPPEGALIVHGVGGTKEQGAGVTFRRSNAGQRDRTFEIVAEALHSNYDAYSAYTGRLAVRMSRDSTPIWQKKYTWALGAQIIGTREQDYDFTLGRRDYKTYFIGGLTGQLGLDFSDDLLNPTKGFRVTTLIEPEGSLQGGFTPYVRARLDASGYYPAGGFVVAGRVRLGTIQGAGLYDLAPSRRFYAGGGGSVRGYAYQKLGPLDPNGDPIGGRSVNEAAVEGRYRFGNYGVVAFVDAGQTYTSSVPKFANLRYGVGVGGRFYTNFGPLRLDIATPLARRAGESRINIYVSIGQAF